MIERAVAEVTGAKIDSLEVHIVENTPDKGTAGKGAASQFGGSESDRVKCDLAKVGRFNALIIVKIIELKIRQYGNLCSLFFFHASFLFHCL